MDAVLNTQSDSCGFVMRNIKLFDDESGGVCDLEIVSMPFCGEIRFFFDFPSLPVFADALAAIERTLAGEAKLGQLYGDSYVMFEGDGKGHVRVSGLLADYTDRVQKLHFCFTTDQTALSPLINGLQAARRLG